MKMMKNWDKQWFWHSNGPMHKVVESQKVIIQSGDRNKISDQKCHFNCKHGWKNVDKTFFQQHHGRE